MWALQRALLLADPLRRSKLASGQCEIDDRSSLKGTPSGTASSTALPDNFSSALPQLTSTPRP